MYEHPVAKWFSDQPTSVRAFKALSGRKKKAETVLCESHVDKKAARIIERHNSHGYTAFLVDIEFEMKMEPAPLTLGLIKALYSYFHTDRWKLVADSGRDLPKILGDVANAMEFILSERDRLAVINEFYFGKHLSIVSPGTLRVLEDALVRINITRNQDLIHTPLRRNDKTARERTLVHDLAKLFRRHYGADKPAAIFHLMMTEGIESSLDQRTIERLIKQWRQERSKIRQLKVD